MKTSIVAPGRRAIFLFVAVISAVVYVPSLWHGYVYDDFAIFSADLYRLPVTRPLTIATFAVDRALQSPALSHAINVGLHVCATLLLFGLARRLFPPAAALMAAVVFALHPIQTEPVNYVWSRATILMTIFCLCSFRDWVAGRHWRAVAWFAAALLAKEECVAFPAVVALFEWNRDRDLGRSKPIVVMFSLAAAVGAAVWIAAAATPGSNAGPHSGYTLMQYFSAQGVAILRYLQMLVLPGHGLSVAPEIPLHAWWAWAAVVVIIGVIGWQWSRSRIAFWFAAGLLLLAPGSSIFPAVDLAADRRMYLPMIAFAPAAGLALSHLRSRLVLASLVAVLAILTASRSRVWRSEQALWSDVLHQRPDSVQARVHLARLAPPERSIALLEGAKNIAPEDPLVASELGRAYLAAGRAEIALAEFGRALAASPGDPQAISNRGVALLLLGQAEAARADFHRALVADPCSFEALYNLRRMGERPPAPESCEWSVWQRDALVEAFR